MGGSRRVGGQNEVFRDGKTLDLALGSTPELVVGVVDEGLFSDHRMFSLDLVRPGSNTSETYEKVPDWYKADFDQVAENLSVIKLE